MVSFGQDSLKHQLFQNRTYFKPFVSELSSTVNKVSMVNVKGLQKKDKELGNVITEVHLGAEFPLYTKNKAKQSFSVFMPVSLHVLWAAFEPKTAPIINNDYRFGFSLAYFQRFESSVLKNVSLKLTPFAHESCHLGDEITIAGMELDRFFRVNVSYEYFELAFTLNDPDTLRGSLLSFRAGFMGLINPTKGYYTYDITETQGIDLYSTYRWAEYYFQIQYRNTHSFLSNARFQFVGSMELRNRIRYQYLKDAAEPREWSMNSYFGYDYSPKGLSANPTTGFYFVLYKGINYHGQLRSSKLSYAGASFVVYLH